MKAKVKTNIDPWDDKVYYELEVGKEYEVELAVIHSWSTSVFLENGNEYNSVMFDDAFDKKLDEAIRYFDKHPQTYSYDVFEKDYY